MYVSLIGGGVSPRVQHIQPLQDDAVVCSDGRRCRYGVLRNRVMAAHPSVAAAAAAVADSANINICAGRGGG